MRIAPAETPRRIAVVGAGPAGLSAAITAAGRGHRVTLFDKAGEIGGQLNMARVIPGKEEFHGLVDWYEVMLRETGVTVTLGAEPRAADLAGFDAVIVATGVRPRDPGINGQDGPNVLSYPDVLRGGARVGRRVAIVGAGGVGFDMAEFLVHEGPSPTEDAALWRREWGVGDPGETRGGLAPQGPAPVPPARQVTLLQRKPERVGKRLGKTTGWIHRAGLRMKGVEMVSGANYERIDADGLHVSFGAAREDRRLIEADTVVLCAGQVSERDLADTLAASGHPRPRHRRRGCRRRARRETRHRSGHAARRRALEHGAQKWEPVLSSSNMRHQRLEHVEESRAHRGQSP